MSTTDTVKVRFVDSSGDTATASFSVDPAADDADIISLIDKMQALSDLEVNSWTRIKEHSYANPTGPAEKGAGHQFADDKAMLKLEFHTTNSKRMVKTVIPGPIESAIPKNDMAADLAQTEVAAACTALADWMTTREGEAITTPKLGYLEINRGKRAAL